MAFRALIGRRSGSHQFSRARKAFALTQGGFGMPVAETSRKTEGV